MADEAVTLVLPATLPPERLREILEAAGRDVAVERAEGPAGPPEEMAAGLVGRAVDAMSASARDLPAALSAGADALRAETGLSPGVIVLLSLGVLLAAWVAELALRRLAPRTGLPAGPRFGERLGAGAGFAVGRAASLAVFALVATVLSRLVFAPGPAQDIFGLTLAIALLQRGLFALVDLIFAPWEAPRRLAGLDDHGARRVALAFAAELVVVGALRLVGALAARLTGGGPVDDGLRVVLLAGWFVAVAAALILVRREFAELIRRAWGGTMILGRRIGDIAHLWLGPALAVAGANAAIAAAAVLGDSGNGGQSGAATLLMLAPFALAGVQALQRDRLQDAPPERRPAIEGGFALAEGVVIVLVAVLLLRAWNINPFATDGAGGGAIVSALCVGVAGFAAWRAVRAFIASYETTPAEDAGGEGMGREGSRLDTALPVLRGFLLTLILAVTLMAALSALGVNVAPLIAGAGIFGLAIGFGAQKLVADVIAGLFYLYEDAFRMGEYIETGAGKGVVEKISLRSLRLRHHRGPIFTIPFSDVGTVQNHSRDWVVVKFTFQVSSGTDVERVRKVVKKVGAELQADPELEGQFLAPLKSQGAISIQGDAFEIGVKYMCRPGEQFAIRRRAYAALQKALEREGIPLHRPMMRIGAADAQSLQAAQ